MTNVKFQAQYACQCPRSGGDVGTPSLSRKNSRAWAAWTASTEPKRRSTASRSISRTGSPGSPLLSHARQAITSWSQQSLVKVVVMARPESHLISRSSEHRRRSLRRQPPGRSCERRGWPRHGALGSGGRERRVRHCPSGRPHALGWRFMAGK